MFLKRQIVRRHLLLMLFILLPQGARAVRISYIDEQSYLNGLAAHGFAPAREGFEDDAAWGLVRGMTEPNVTNMGVTWTSNDANGEITTGSGAAYTGDWGFYALPHNPLGDGFIGTSSGTLYGAGGWFRTNTPVAKMGLILDANEFDPVDFGEICEIVDGEEVNCVDLVLSNEWAFRGVIDTDGFAMFEFRELEGLPGDQKLIFSDDFTFGIAPLQCTMPTVGDINFDCRVGPTDLSLMSFNWLIEAIDCPPNPPGDLNNDCVVNFLDFAKMTSHWLECNLNPPQDCWE